MQEYNKLAGIIVRNITEIEEASHIACTQLSDRLKEEILHACKDDLDEYWNVEASGEDDEGILRIYPDEWFNESTDEVEFYLCIDEVEDPNNQVEHSWIAAAIQSDPTPSKLPIYFMLRHKSFISETKFGKLLAREAELIASLKRLNIERDASGKYLLVPIAKIDAEWLAASFEENDFDAALEPVRDALEQATSDNALAGFQRVVELVRREARV